MWPIERSGCLAQGLRCKRHTMPARLGPPTSSPSTGRRTRAREVALVRRLLVGCELACVVLVPPGCSAARTARIYDVSTGRASTIDIDRKWDAGGSLSGVLPSGERCKGSFGDISGNKSAVLDCEGRVIECSLAAREMTDVGFGLCHDANGAEYAMFF